jgi:hypothetical protein
MGEPEAQGRRPVATLRGGVVKLIYTITATCAPPSGRPYDPKADRDLLDELEEIVAASLIGTGLSFVIGTTLTVEAS